MEQRPRPLWLDTVCARISGRTLALAASPRAPVAAVAGYGAIDLVDPATRSLLGGLAFPEGEPLVLSFSRSGRLLLAAGGKPVQSGTVVLFDVATGKRLASVADEPDAIIAADISPDEKLVAIGCTSRNVKLYVYRGRHAQGDDRQAHRLGDGRGLFAERKTPRHGSDLPP